MRFFCHFAADPTTKEKPIARVATSMNMVLRKRLSSKNKAKTVSPGRIHAKNKWSDTM